jgi:hypothetical protein
MSSKVPKNSIFTSIKVEFRTLRISSIIISFLLVILSRTGYICLFILETIGKIIRVYTIVV